MTGRAPFLLALCDLLDTENDALSRSDTAATGRLLEEKNRLVRELRAGAAAAAPADPVSPAIAARFTESIRRNQVLLERAMLVQRRMIGTIVAAARVPSASTGYRSTGYQVRASVAAIALMRKA